MSAQYAKEQAQSKQGQTYGVETPQPAYTSRQTVLGYPAASSVLSLTDGTTVLQIAAYTGTANTGGIIFKWGSASVTTANADGYVAVGAPQTYVVPVSITGINSVAGANVANGLYNSVALKQVSAAALASVLTMEY